MADVSWTSSAAVRSAPPGRFGKPATDSVSPAGIAPASMIERYRGWNNEAWKSSACTNGSRALSAFTPNGRRAGLPKVCDRGLICRSKKRVNALSATRCSATPNALLSISVSKRSNSLLRALNCPTTAACRCRTSAPRPLLLRWASVSAKLSSAATMMPRASAPLARMLASSWPKLRGAAGAVKWREAAPGALDCNSSYISESSFANCSSMFCRTGAAACAAGVRVAAMTGLVIIVENASRTIDETAR